MTANQALITAHEARRISGGGQPGTWKANPSLSGETGRITAANPTSRLAISLKPHHVR